MIIYKLSDFNDSSIVPPERVINRINKLYTILKIDEQDNQLLEHKNKKHRKKSDITLKPVVFTKFQNTKQTEEELLNNNLRVFLNKISADNYDIQKENIIHILDIINKKEDLNKTLLLYLEISTINRSLIDIYVKLWIDILERYDTKNEYTLLLKNKYINSIKDIRYIDPDVDYDNHCKINKENDKRRNLLLFMGKMIKKEEYCINELITLINSIILIIRENSNDITRIDITNEYVELLYLCFNDNIDCVQQTSEWNNINNFIQEYIKIDKVNNKGISSRAVFKIMDINEKIKI